MNIKSEFVNLVELIFASLEANHAYAQTLKVHLRFVDPAIPVWILGDPARLMQVMANLLSNAAKFSPVGESVTISLHPVETATGTVVRLDVHNGGDCIPLAFQPHIFEPFTQADGSNTRQQGSSGLGLPITKTLVEKCKAA